MAFVEHNGAQIAWAEQGEGPAVLLINGLSSPSAVWFRLAPLLAEHHRVITFDNLGTGATGVPPGPYTMDMLADAAYEVVQAAGATSTAVLGISMGGLIAQHLTLEHPELVSSLVLVATHAGMAHATGDPDAAEAIRNAGSLPPEERYGVLARYTHATTTPAERIAEDSAVRAAHPTSEEGYANQLQGVIGWDRLDDLQRISCPTLVLHGEQDLLISADSARLLADRLPDARFTVLEDCGHQLFTDQPQRGAAAVLEFLAASRTVSAGP